MANLPILKSNDTNLMLMQNKWSSVLNPVIANPSLSTSILNNIQLISGTNTINHKLGRKLVGWRIVRLRGPATLYDDQDPNPTPNLTLVLISNASVNCDIEVF